MSDQIGYINCTEDIKSMKRTKSTKQTFPITSLSYHNNIHEIIILNILEFKNYCLYTFHWKYSTISEWNILKQTIRVSESSSRGTYSYSFGLRVSQVMLSLDYTIRHEANFEVY